MRPISVQAFVSALTLVGCGSTPTSTLSGFGGSPAGGATQGGSASATGGTSSAGGTSNPTGGKASTGGTTNPTGGTSSTGGTSNPTGGKASTGGTTNPTGGTSSAGGTSNPTGGTSSTGGTSNPTGGKASTGGTSNPTGGTSSAGGTSNPTGGTSTMGGTSNPTGGKASTGGTGPTNTGGTTASGGVASGGTTGSSGGSTGTRSEGPCDIYGAANTPCVAAYSMVRALSKTYSGPLYQVRSGSSSQNTGTGGTTHDIGMTADGYADVASQDAVCSGTTCTVSLLYDQSGNGNNLPVAKKGLSNGGTYAAMDDFESSATMGAVTAGGHKVYSLYTAAREGYRLAAKGKNVPLGTAAQGIYELADGTHSGTACCWDFGNVTTDPTKYGVMNTLFFGTAFWGTGAGSGPWFMADFEAGVWAGGSNPGDPGWGALDSDAPPNTNNPSMKVPFAFGILKTDPSNYAIRVADLQNATNLTTAYAGALPKAMNNLGGIVLGVGGDNSNNSWGTFYEGAITSGFPSNDTDLAVLKNVQAVGYKK